MQRSVSTAYRADTLSSTTGDSEGRSTPPVISVPWEQHAPPQQTQPAGASRALPTGTGGPATLAPSVSAVGSSRGHVFLPNRVPTSWESSRVLSQWEGTVVEAQKHEFVADLRDVLDHDREYSASIPLEEIPTCDRSLIQPGAVFDWVIGIRIEHGTQETFSRIMFRRLPAWSSSELRRLEHVRGSYDALFKDGQ